MNKCGRGFSEISCDVVIDELALARQPLRKRCKVGRPIDGDGGDGVPHPIQSMGCMGESPAQAQAPCIPPQGNDATALHCIISGVATLH